MFHVFEILMPWAVNSHEVFALVRRFVRRVLADAPPLEDLDLFDALGLER